MHKCEFIRCISCLFNGWLLALNNHEQIKTAVMFGNRPPLDAITGPADLVSFATRWIELCWHESPGERPSFDGK